MLTDNQTLPAVHGRLPLKTVLGFVDRYFRDKDAFLDLVRQHGSPLYVVDPNMLTQRADQFKAAFNQWLPETGFYYAMKSNNLPLISEHLLNNGFGLDVSSGLELATALDLGARSIIFSGPGKTDQELDLASDHPDRVVILLDSMGECCRLAKVLEQKNRVQRVGIRLNSNPDGLWRKFGVLPGNLAEVYQKIKSCHFMRFQGLQFHSSWNLDPARQVAFIIRLAETLQGMPDGFLGELEFIDIGGGYWPCQGEWLLGSEPGSPTLAPADTIETFAKHLSDAIQTHIFPLTGCRICFEPGRWICNDAMHIIIEVVDKKSSDLVITDAGTNTVGWERYEVDYCPVLNLTRPGRHEHACHILGSLCTPHDVWGYSYFGTGIREKDILLIPAQGAYTYSLRQQFIKPLPQVVVK